MTISSATVDEHICFTYIQNPNPLTSSSSMSQLMNSRYISGELFPPCRVPCNTGNSHKNKPGARLINIGYVQYYRTHHLS